MSKINAAAVALTNALKPATKRKPATKNKPAAAPAQDANYATVLDACRAALGLSSAMQQVKQGKATLGSMADRMKAAGIDGDAVKAAKETFSATLHAILGAAMPERSRGEATTNAAARMLVKGMAEAAGIDKLRLEAALNAEQRKALYAAPMKALQRLAPPKAPVKNTPADPYEAAEQWAKKLAAEFTGFRPKSLTDPAFKRFAQTLFDSLTGVGE